MSAAFETITLRNGQRAVRHLESGEVMHPSVGPWEEANRLYVDQPELRARLGQAGPLFRVWDVGLGAATNAVATLSAAHAMGAARVRPLEVLSFEETLEPLRLALEDPEGFPSLTPWQAAARTLCDRGEWSEGELHWKLVQGDFLAHIPRAPAQLVLFDPFSPETNPRFWRPEALTALREAAMHPEEGTLLVTYSASTRTRVSLLQAGFFVGQGVSVGTRQETTVAATQLSLLKTPLGERWLQRWQRSDARSPHGHAEIPDLIAHPQFAPFARQKG